MNGGILPLLLLSSALGLVLSFVPLRIAVRGAAIAVAVSLALYGLAPLGELPEVVSKIVFPALWISIIATAAIAYLPFSATSRWVAPATVNAGLWIGLRASVSATWQQYAVGIAPIALFVAGRWFTKRDYSIVIKVVVSWLIAIAILSIFVSMTPTPGYEPDHMQ